MNLSNTNNIFPHSENPQGDNYSDIFSTIKLGYPQEMLVAPSVGNFSSLQLQNQLFKNQINELQKLVLQYEFTNKKALETLRENIMLRDKAMTLELKVGLLSETTDLQALEIKKRDHNISSLRKEIAEHNKRIELLSEKCEQEGFPACNICCRNPPVVTICKNHCEADQVVGCVFCALRKCPICRNKDIERSFVQKESKKIKKAPKRASKKTKEDKDFKESKVNKGGLKNKK